MTDYYEIRECPGCGLRYPLMAHQSFGTRCPACLNETTVVVTRQLYSEKPAGPQAPAVPLEALLDNIRSAWNVGSIFRTADGFGLRHLHLCGITPTPEQAAVRKTSLGAEHTVGWTYRKNVLLAARQLKSSGYRLYALEAHARSIPVQSARGLIHGKQVVLVAGNEVTGVDPGVLELCDEILFIPMSGRKRSFNVAVAFAVALSQFVL